MRTAWLLVALLPSIANGQPALDDAARRRVAERCAPGVVGLTVSHDPRHLPLPEGAPQPLILGRYPAAGQKIDPALDLADPSRGADFTLGSGVVLDAEAGHVLTTYSLIEGARKVYVRGATGRGSYADIHAADARADLAVLKIIDPIVSLKAIPVHRGRTTGSASGEPPTIVPGLGVVTLGHPGPAQAGRGRPVFGTGTIGEVRRRWPGSTDRPGDDPKYKPLGRFAVLVVCDVRATYACPGAAILNADGELVALTSPALGVAGPDAGGYAVPMDVNFRRIIDTLRQGREVEYGFLGVTFDQRGMRPMFPGLGGLTISGVTPGGPAALAQLRGGPRGFLGDTITAVDGTPLDEPDDLFLAVGAALAGSRVTIDVVGANGQERRVTATLAKFPHHLPKLASVGPPGAFGITVDYASVLTLQQSLSSVPPGVAAVVPDDSPVKNKLEALVPAGREPPRAWVVLAVDGQEVNLPREFARLTADKKSATLTVADAAEPYNRYQIVLPE